MEVGEMSPETLTACPSFRRISYEEEDEGGHIIIALEGSPQEIPAVHPPAGDDKVGEEDGDGDGDGGYSSDDFEFAFVSSESSDAVEPITADEIFSNGRIRPVYPLFNRDLLFFDPAADHEHNNNNRFGEGGAAPSPAAAEKAIRIPLRKLLIEDRDPPSTSSSESDELVGIPKDSYCVWKPGSVPASPDLHKKSHSTGSLSKRWRLRDLVIGRSHSDGKEKFLFLAPPPPAAAAAEKKKQTAEAKGNNGKGRVRKVSEMDTVAAHRLYYPKGGEVTGDRRRSFLPYRKNLVGFFGSVDGAGLNFHLF